MAKRQLPQTPLELTVGGTVVLPPPENANGDDSPQTTGRFIVIFKDEVADTKSMKKSLQEITGLNNIASSATFETSGVTSEVLDANGVIHFEKLGIAIVSDSNALASLSASTSEADSPVLAIEPEYYAYLSEEVGSANLNIDYLRGYRDAVNHLYDQLAGHLSDNEADAIVSALFDDTTQFSWGLQATGVHLSRFSGQGVRIAVLDTGFDFQHPDFQGRNIISQTFTEAPVQDIHGHGTHCVGTACGPQRPFSGVRRYGVAFNAQIFVGKVFNNNQPRPSAPTGSVIAGIEWAVANGCRVASLSLGAPIDQKIFQYEVPIRRALNAGTLVVCAAGNNASRPVNPGFVEPPANADSSMAVAAIDNLLRIASFSGRSSTLTGDGGKVNIAGPGVRIFSSVPLASGTHAFFNGTSMATPHVAGIAALWAEATGLSGVALWNQLVQTSRPLNLPSVDVGSGLAQAPR